MRHLVVAALVLVGAGTTAFAQCPTVIPWDGYGRCAARPAPGGGVSVLGYDAARGSYWTTAIDPRGNMYGYDARGNYWRYDRRGGSYIYYNTVRDW